MTNDQKNSRSSTDKLFAASRGLGPKAWKRSRSEVADALDTALAKLVRSEYEPLNEHDREWARAIRYWLAGADEEEAVRLVIADRG